jgi:phosphoglycolate phosphatase
MVDLLFPSGQVLKDINHIIFDKDGTIFDIHHYWTSMIQLRAKTLCNGNTTSELFNHLCANMGIDSSGKRLKPEGPVGIASRSTITQIVSETLNEFGKNTSPASVESEFKDVDKLSCEFLDEFLVVLPGLVDFLDECKKHSLTMSIATTDLTERAKTGLELKQLDHYFTLIKGGDSVQNTKPHPDIINLILKETNTKPSEAVMIGDHHVDILTAMNAKLAGGIGVATGLLREKDFLINTQYTTETLTGLKIS